VPFKEFPLTWIYGIAGTKVRNKRRHLLYRVQYALTIDLKVTFNRTSPIYPQRQLMPQFQDLELKCIYTNQTLDH